MQCKKCGRESSPQYQSIRQGRGCGYCSGKRIDLAEAKATMLDAGVVPLVDFPGTHSPWLCRCVVCGEEVSPTYNSINSGGQGGCAICAGRKVKPEAAVEVMRAAGLEPLVEFPGSGTPWLCQCMKCSAEVKPRYSGVQQGQGGCSACASGFSSIALSMVYLMAHPAYQALKVGICNVGTGRVDFHQRDGWELLTLVDTDTGDEARTIEEINKENRRGN